MPDPFNPARLTGLALATYRERVALGWESSMATYYGTLVARFAAMQAAGDLSPSVVERMIGVAWDDRGLMYQGRERYEFLALFSGMIRAAYEEAQQS